METMTETLRAAILAYESRYRLSLDSGVDAAALCRFVAGESSMTLDTIERLAPVLGLRLVVENGAGTAKATTPKRSTTRKAGR